MDDDDGQYSKTFSSIHISSKLSYWSVEHFFLSISFADTHTAQLTYIKRIVKSAEFSCYSLLDPGIPPSTSTIIIISDSHASCLKADREK